MEPPSLLDQVRELRGQGKSPKQIARALGVAPAAVTPLIRRVAAESRPDDGVAKVVGCWVNRGWSVGLTVEPARGWADGAAQEDSTSGGLASVVVAREHGWDKVSVCGYLVDVYCLGVKNAHGPEIGDELDLRRFRERYFSAYADGFQEAPFELAQHLVLGAVDYARGLGFEPHQDFAKVAAHLGEWAGASAITFGREGKPFYISGPYDDERKVMRTLEKAVGAPPNFDYIVVGQPFA